jgi:hypothetical protein
MHDRDDVNESRIDPVEDRIRETIDESAAKVSEDNRRPLWTCLNLAKGNPDVVTKALPETFTTLFVEPERRQRVDLGLFTENTRVTTRFETSRRARLPRES